MKKEITFEITYEYESAQGALIQKTVTNKTKEEADEICKAVEVTLGYKLIDITTEIKEVDEKPVYNLKYFEENKVVIDENQYGEFAYDLDGHRIGTMKCDRGSRYYMLWVDGKMIATRARRDNAIRLALDYLNK